MATPRAKPKTAKALAQQARRGETEAALAGLLPLAAGGDGAAAASGAELLAFLGRWDEVVPLATQLVAEPRAVRTGNVFTDMCGLIRRAARELQEPGVVSAAAAKVPAGMEARRDAVLLRDFVPPSAQPGPEDRPMFEAAARLADGAATFRGKPRELARHLFALAVGARLGDEILARWTPDDPLFGFETALDVARTLVRRGEGDDAWAAIVRKLPEWWPLDTAQVAPVVLLLDPWLAPLLTSARASHVLETPRGPEGRPPEAPARRE